ncbi:MAG: hypothetical protein ACRC0G_07290 [Fusobacteriaceae bacterium]
MVLLSIQLQASSERVLEGFIFKVVTDKYEIKRYTPGSDSPVYIIVDYYGNKNHVKCSESKITDNMPTILVEGVSRRPIYRLKTPYKDKDGTNITHEIE